MSFFYAALWYHWLPTEFHFLLDWFTRSFWMLLGKERRRLLGWVAPPPSVLRPLTNLLADRIIVHVGAAACWTNYVELSWQVWLSEDDDDRWTAGVLGIRVIDRVELCRNFIHNFWGGLRTGVGGDIRDGEWSKKIGGDYTSVESCANCAKINLSWKVASFGSRN